MASSSASPCAACKFLRRKCQPDCVFAPYFPPDNPQKFSNVHKVFGAANVTKLLNELHPSQRDDAVNSLAYEAEARLRDPVYGCVGLISLLTRQLQQLQMDLSFAKSELSKYQNFAGVTAMHGGLFSTHHHCGGHHFYPSHYHHQFFPRDHGGAAALGPPQMIKSAAFDEQQSGNPNLNNNNNFNVGDLLAINNVTESIGLLSQFQQSAREEEGDDEHCARPEDPS